MFYFSLYPEIPIRGIDKETIRELMKQEPNYEELKLQLQGLLNQNQSPLDNTQFVEAYQTCAHDIILLYDSELKSATDFNVAGKLQFKFSRDGLVTFPKGLPTYAYVGIEVLRDNQKYTDPILFGTDKLVIAPSSILAWFITKIFEKEPPKSQSIQ